MSGLFIDVGETCGAIPEGYGCNWYYNVKDYRCIFDELNQIEKRIKIDKYVIHFDGLYMDILEKMIAEGKNTNKYEVRIHGVGREQYKLFWDYVNEHWTDQTGWFKR